MDTARAHGPTSADDYDLPHFEETIVATTRYLATLEDLSDDDVRAPSLLPGWTRAHVISHLSRNADALARVLRAAQSGAEATMYDTDEQRDAEIEAGSGRDVASLREDASASWGRLLQAENEIHDSHLDASFSRTPGSPPMPVRRLGWMRRVEVEVHHADLDLGYTAEDWPREFTRHLLEQRQQELVDGPPMVLVPTDDDERWTVGAGEGPEITGTLAAVTWWLLGRGTGAGVTSASGELPRVDRWR